MRLRQRFTDAELDKNFSHTVREEPLTLNPCLDCSGIDITNMHNDFIIEGLETYQF